MKKFLAAVSVMTMMAGMVSAMSVSAGSSIYGLPIPGDADDDCKLTVRDCACIAAALANGNVSKLPRESDYNLDQKIDIRDAAALSRALAKKDE